MPFISIRFDFKIDYMGKLLNVTAAKYQDHDDLQRVCKNLLICSKKLAVFIRFPVIVF